MQQSAKHKGHFALYNWLVLGHTTFKGMQRIHCNPFPAKPFYGCHRMGLVMIQLPGIESGAFAVILSAMLGSCFCSPATDTGSKTFDFALVSTLETYDYSEFIFAGLN